MIPVEIRTSGKVEAFFKLSDEGMKEPLLECSSSSSWR
jgi:hypothetical protein